MMVSKEADAFSFEAAIESHQDWKQKLKAAILSGEALDADTIRKDDCCQLGKWLHGEGRILYGNKNEYFDLCRKHAFFHKLAGVVATSINTGRVEMASNLVEGHGTYARASHEVVLAIDTLRYAANFRGENDRRAGPRVVG